MSTADGGDHPSPPPARPLRVPRPEDGLAGKRVRSRRLASPARHPVVPVDFHDVYDLDEVLVEGYRIEVKEEAEDTP